MILVTGPPRRGKENFLLHADVPQYSGTELAERTKIDPAGVDHRCFQEPVEAAVISGEELVEWTLHHPSAIREYDADARLP